MGIISIIKRVTTFAVVWIEIKYAMQSWRTTIVTTFAVVWIEIFLS